MIKHQYTAAFLIALFFSFSLLGAAAMPVSAAKRVDTLKIVTWNIRHGNDQILEQQAQLNAIDADVCLLQEVDEGTSRVNGISCLKTLGRKYYPYRYFGHNFSFRDGQYGLGILSKTRLTDFNPRPQMEEEAWDLGLTKGTGRLNGEVISYYNAHFSYEDDLLRVRQIQTAALLLAQDENPYKILAGDLNIKDFSELAPFEGFGIVNCEESYYPTYQGLDWYTQAIDNVIYSADTLRLLEAQMVVSDFSDHNALAATFEILTPVQEEAQAEQTEEQRDTQSVLD